MESEGPVSLIGQVEAAYVAAERMSMRVTKDSPAGAKVFQYPLKFKVSVPLPAISWDFIGTY